MAIAHGGNPIDLDGMAGGTYVSGASGEHVHIDAVEFCRVLSRTRPAPACWPPYPYWHDSGSGYGRPAAELVTRRFAGVSEGRRRYLLDDLGSMDSDLP